jgi:hypothetical protein
LGDEQMPKRFPAWLILMALGLVLPLTAWLSMPPSQAAAQCGVRASSCKTCHETQAKYPVKTNGEWHLQHSFGDFCVYCHAGNMKTLDKAKAHAGLIQPLDNVTATCAVCHTDDCNTRAQEYATILGVTVGQGNDSASPAGPAPLLPFVARPVGTGDQPALLGGQQPSPFAQLSTGPTEDLAESRQVNWGNVSLALIALVLALGGGGLVFRNERKLAVATATGWDRVVEARPELGELMPLLSRADAQTVKVITRTLAERNK